MGKKAPKAPDMTKYTEMSERLGTRALDQSDRQQAWAEQMWTEQRDLLKEVLGPQLDIMKMQYENGMKDRQRYEQLYQPLEENLIAEFQSYDTPERRAQRAGAAQAQVAAAQKGAKDAARQRLEGFGIDPSQTRSAALDRNLEAAEAAQQAAAGNMERNNVENTGRALRAEAINIGRGMPSQVAQSYGQSIAAGSTALGGMNSTVNTGSGTMGTGQSWAGQGLAANGQGANITNAGFQNKLNAYSAQGNPWELVAGIGGAWAGSGFAVGANDGGIIAPEEMDHPTQQTATGHDAIPASLTPGEYVIPKEVVTFLGVDKLNKIVAKAREAQGIPEDRKPAAAPAPIRHPSSSREVSSRAPFNTGGAIPHTAERPLRKLKDLFV